MVKMKRIKCGRSTSQDGPPGLSCRCFFFVSVESDLIGDDAMLKLKSYCNRGKTWTLILMMSFIMILSGPAMASAANSDWDTAIAGIGQLHDAFSALELENKTEKLLIQELSRQNNAKLKSIQTSVQ